MQYIDHVQYNQTGEKINEVGMHEMQAGSTKPVLPNTCWLKPLPLPFTIILVEDGVIMLHSYFSQISPRFPMSEV